MSIRGHNPKLCKLAKNQMHKIVSNPRWSRAGKTNIIFNNTEKKLEKGTHFGSQCVTKIKLLF